MEKLYDERRELEWFWLCSIPGLFEADRKRLLQAYREPGRLYAEAKGKKGLLPVLTEKKLQAVCSHWELSHAQDAYHKWREKGIQFISCENPLYPARLLQIPDYPSGLFYKGAMISKEERSVAVIGARMCTYNGRNTAQELSERLAQNGVSVVSGMAYGIDARAQEACIKAGGKSYAVLGCGADICYPKENRGLYEALADKGGVISEFYPGTSPASWHFPMRNRIISGLSEIVVVVEARKKSGTLITADLALEQGRDVYAFPGRMQDALSAGCNRLIQEGAGMITDIEEFLETNGFLMIRAAKEKNPNLVLASSEKLVYSCLDSDAKNLQTLAEETDLPIWQLMGVLSALELKGLASESGKNNYVKMK